MRAIDRMRLAQAGLIKNAILCRRLLVDERHDKRTLNACLSRGWLADTGTRYPGEIVCYAVTLSGYRWLLDYMIDGVTDIAGATEIRNVSTHFVAGYVALESYLEGVLDTKQGRTR